MRSVLDLFRIPTFSIMMASRLLSGHLLITIFGIQFLVTERGFSNAIAALVLLPFGIGYFVGTIGSGYLVALLDRVLPDRGRVAFIQSPRSCSRSSPSSAPSSSLRRASTSVIHFGPTHGGLCPDGTSAARQEFSMTFHGSRGFSREGDHLRCL